ncbi:hypothetical protein WNY98_19465, partial [Pseudoalteromonas sp. AS71]|uniref:hypothetical protein n=1 Tax=Pseudoalteromonas sp. AS71 TaxID=3135777 RepID=UPI00316EE1B8
FHPNLYAYQHNISFLMGGQINYATTTYKNDLTRQSNSELEELKTTLKISEIKSNVQISHLHEKQAESIFTIHKYMWELFSSLEDYTTVFQARTLAEKEGKRLSVANDLEQLRIYHQLNSLYLSEKLSENITSIIKNMQKTAFEFMNEVERESGKDMLDKWDSIHKEVNTQIKSTINGLANEFRSVLGVS